MSVDFYTGDKPYESWDRELKGPNFANINARAVLDALGLDAGEYLTGRCEPAAIIRGAIKLENTHTAERHARPEQRGTNWIAYGLDADGIRERANCLADFARKAQAKGYNVIWWG